MGSQGHYNVPCIPPDLRSEESILAVCSSLQYLEQVASDVFARISERVGAKRTQLAQLNERIALAQAKIDRIRGTNRATRVFSTAKYPGSDENKYSESIFAHPLENLHQPKATKYNIHSKFTVLDDKVSYHKTWQHRDF